MSAEFPESIVGDTWRYLVSALGGLLFFVGVGSALLDGRLSGTELLQVSSLAVLSALLVVVGARIALDIGDATDALRVLGWMSVGVLALAALGAWFQIVVPTARTGFETALLFLSALAAGGLFGAVVGYYDVRVRGLVERASRESARREFLDEQQEVLSALNGILRHQILNDLSAISGRAELLAADRVDADGATETIETHCDHMAEIVDRVETVVDVLTLTTTTGETDLDRTIDRAIATLREDHPGAEIRVRGETDATVLADDLLYLAVYEVLDNAVVHGSPPVTVTVGRETDDVRIAVTDTGGGVDVTPRESLFEPNTRGSESGGDGLGLFLAQLILDRYGGEIGLKDGERTTVGLRLPGPRDGDTRP